MFRYWLRIYRIKDKSRLRLAAANGLIKLLENVNYADNITIDQFLQLSLTIQVSFLYLQKHVYDLRTQWRW